MSEKVAIVGSRQFGERAAEVRQQIADYIAELPRGDEIVTGGALGADAWAEFFAKRDSRPVHVFPADWQRYGRRAGAVRNKQIVDAADRVVAFWDGKSPGTKITIDMATRAGKPVEVITP